ncbi:hypothetical protein D3C87_348610 [compost metagenome]|jgi:hypothetical protein|uniref:nuclear transport factor 2 family protein n=1 Tax=Achromobacter sp. Root83 TaxID=1736602 RepID=UPI0007104F55|nr:nuclear transport factor 2 family protein [Achromobacter sp. Root83]KRC77850.1 hypothetical protein ASE30_27165 [Achromobacter sp. Root83]
MNDKTSLRCEDAAAQVLNFFAALDQRRHDDVAQLMASDGIWHRQGRALTGPADVAAALAERDPARETAHIVTNLRAELTDAGRARVRFYLLAYESRTDGGPQEAAPRLVAIRSCTDELVHTESGWRFASRASHRHLPPEAHAR